MSTFTQKIVQICNEEWEFFENQTTDINGNYLKRGKTETDLGYWERVGVYWNSVGKNLTGKNTDYPWSAAFISYIMKKAGAGNNFKYSTLHSVYIRAAIAAKNTPGAPFKGYKVNELKLKVGDLVGYNREPNVTYDNLPPYFKSHCDIVVAVRPNEIDVIGGNVGNSVTKKTLRIDSNGKLTDQKFPWFVAIENNL